MHTQRFVSLLAAALALFLASLSVAACSSDNPAGPADAAIDAKLTGSADAGLDAGAARDGGLDGGTGADGGH